MLWFEMAGKTSSKFDENKDDRMEVTIDLQKSMMLPPRHVLQLHKIGLDYQECEHVTAFVIKKQTNFNIIVIVTYLYGGN